MKVKSIAPQEIRHDGEEEDKRDILYENVIKFVDKDVVDIFKGIGFFPTSTQLINAQIAKNLREVSIQLKELNMKDKC